MQNKYVGDIGDYDKYYLLNALTKSGIKLGVNWCFVSEDLNDNNDGMKVEYLKSEQPDDLPDLRKNIFQKLKEIVFENNEIRDTKKGRDLQTIESSGILPTSTVFYNAIIPAGTKRFAWHNESLSKLNTCDLIFYDPDNGLERGSYGKLNKKANKFVFFDEIVQAYSAGKTILIYQHAPMDKKTVIDAEDRIQELADCLPTAKKENIRAFFTKFQRYYLLVVQEHHLIEIENICASEILPYFQNTKM